MAKITLRNVTPYDGDYDLDIEQPYNGHELHLIKKVSGVRLGEIEEAGKAGDYDLVVALAVIALWRAGKVKRADVLEAAELLLGVEAGSIVLAMEADASPPAMTVESGGSSQPSSPISNGTGDVLQVTSPLSTGNPG